MTAKREYAVTRPVKMQPTHPGVLLREAIDALDVSVATAASELGVSRQTLHAVLAGRAAVTPAMAVRIGKWCGNGADLWLNMQVAHDLWHARAAMADAVAAIPTRQAA